MRTFYINVYRIGYRYRYGPPSLTKKDADEKAQSYICSPSRGVKVLYRINLKLK